ncbi:MAG: cell division protein SepF [Oscillospiraceae bacterium]|nr:cell division protein SepF [Oscillospiraceae bacterium]MBQ9982198.1 cell division protein SepF [Oscillospiraceae bacterium]
MKLLDSLKDFFLPPEQEDDYQPEAPKQEMQPVATHQIHQPQPSEMIETPDEKRNKVVNIQATAQLQVVLVKPEVFTDAKQIADHLIAKKTVVLNLETASSENKRRIIDFLVGVAYANGGSLKPVANLTYIITPYNVGFIGEDLVGELENNGVII